MRRNIIRNLFLAALTLIVIYCLFEKSSECISGIKQGIALCMNAVIPSLLPFMIVSQFILKSGLAEFLGCIFNKATRKIFKLSGICSSVIIMSLIGGFPVGAKMTCELLESGKISKNEAQRLNLFCINAGPAFVIGTVGEIFTSSRKAGIILFFSTVAASLSVGILSTFLYDGTPIKKSDISPDSFSNPVNAFSQAVTDASRSMFWVCSWVIVFNAVIKCILSIGDEQYLTIICSLLEVTNGIMLSCRLLPFPVLASMLSFAGLSVHCQIFSYIQKSELDLKLFYTARVLCAMLSGIACHILLHFFPFEINVFASSSSVTMSAYSVSLPSAIALIVMCCSLIFELDKGKKVC